MNLQSLHESSCTGEISPCRSGSQFIPSIHMRLFRVTLFCSRYRERPSEAWAWKEHDSNECSKGKQRRKNLIPRLQAPLLSDRGGLSVRRSRYIWKLKGVKELTDAHTRKVFLWRSSFFYVCEIVEQARLFFSPLLFAPTQTKLALWSVWGRDCGFSQRTLFSPRNSYCLLNGFLTL